MSNIRIACTAILKRINAGRINKAGTAFVGEPVDCTSDCLKAIIDFIGEGKAATVQENGVPAFEIEVRRVGLAASSAPSAAPFPERDQSKPAEQQGLFKKFRVQRLDGSDCGGGKHYGCRYYVLDLNHDQHAPAAMRAYAAACRATHPQLADDIEAEFGAAQLVGEASVKTWQQEAGELGLTANEAAACMVREIADLRDLVARHGAAPSQVAQTGLLSCGVCGDGQLYCNSCGTGFAIPVSHAAQTAEPVAGWKMVPVKLTEEMHVAAVRAIIRATGNDDCPPSVWAAMLAAAPILPSHPKQAEGYEATFQREIAALVMSHIDRMNDVCEQDTAEQIIASFTEQFDPILETYLAAKFPGRDRQSSAQSKGEGA